MKLSLQITDEREKQKLKLSSSNNNNNSYVTSIKSGIRRDKEW